MIFSQQCVGAVVLGESYIFTNRRIEIWFLGNELKESKLKETDRAAGGVCPPTFIARVKPVRFCLFTR